MTIYVVTSGSYSDYGINAVFLDRDKAKAWIEFNRKEYWDNFNDIMEIETYDDKVPDNIYLRAKGKEFYNVSYLKDKWEVDNEPQYLWQKANLIKDGTFYITVLAKDEEHALKIAQDERAKMMAEVLE